MSTLTTSLQNGIVAAASSFWRWWRNELVQLLPASVRSRLQHRQLLPDVLCSEKQWEVWVPSLEGDRATRVKQAVLDRTGDPEARLFLAREAIAQLASPVALSLPPSMVLRRTLVLPAALEENLRQALAYDLDRHTPFQSDELYFDAQVVGRDSARNEIRVELAAVQRTHADRAMAQLREAGAEIVAFLADSPENIESKHNLLPVADRPSWQPWQRWAVATGAAIIVLLLLAAMALPIWQKRAYAIEMRQQADVMQIQAAEVTRLHDEIDRLVADHDFVPERKKTYPATVHILNEITRLLPDDTWLTQMELKNTVGGKETRYEVVLRGESAYASRLVTLLEESGLVTQAAPRSPFTAIRVGADVAGEIFDIGAQIKRLPTAERVAVVMETRVPPALPPTLPTPPPEPEPEPTPEPEPAAAEASPEPATQGAAQPLAAPVLSPPVQAAATSREATRAARAARAAAAAANAAAEKETPDAELYEPVEAYEAEITGDGGIGNGNSEYTEEEYAPHEAMEERE